MNNTKTYLTPHFTLEELCASGTAVRLGLDNSAPEPAQKRLLALCENVLEPLRRRFGAIRVTSGYRCPKLNEAVGGALGSQHLLGEAADLHISDQAVGRKMYDFIAENLDFDQLLFERKMSNGCQWLHVSYTTRRENRREAKRMKV